MLANLKHWPRAAIVLSLILVFTVVAAYRASAFPGQSPPGFRNQPPEQPATPSLPTRQPDDIRFVRANQRAQQSQNAMAGNTGANGGGLQGGIGGAGGLGGIGGSGGGFFGQGRVRQIINGQPMDPGQDDGFRGTFNFGGFKGYGFGGGDLSSWRGTDGPALK